jgi:hypothetical protein
MVAMAMARSPMIVLITAFRLIMASLRCDKGVMYMLQVLLSNATWKLTMLLLST